VLATIGFVIGTSAERHKSTYESAVRLRVEGAASKPATRGEGGQRAATHAAKGGNSESSEGSGAPTEGGEGAARHAAETHAEARTEPHKELHPLGVNLEAGPFIVLAALASLALALLGWFQPRRPLGPATIAAAMIVFGVLDVREAFHQSDEQKTGLLILAAVICGAASRRRRPGRRDGTTRAARRGRHDPGVTAGSITL
jgi:hypothetical protein